MLASSEGTHRHLLKRSQTCCDQYIDSPSSALNPGQRMFKNVWEGRSHVLHTFNFGSLLNIKTVFFFFFFLIFRYKFPFTNVVFFFNIKMGSRAGNEFPPCLILPTQRRKHAPEHSSGSALRCLWCHKGWWMVSMWCCFLVPRHLSGSRSVASFALITALPNRVLAPPTDITLFWFQNKRFGLTRSHTSWKTKYPAFLKQEAVNRRLNALVGLAWCYVALV